MKMVSTITIQFSPVECIEFCKFARNLRSALVYLRNNRFNEDLLKLDEVNLLKSIDYVNCEFNSVYEFLHIFSKLG